MPGCFFDSKYFRMARIRHGDLNKRDARIGLLPPSCYDAHIVSGVRHQARVVTHHAFHTAYDGRRRIMQKRDLRHRDFSRAASIARSMNTAEDQPNIDAALGGFSPLTGS